MGPLRVSSAVESEPGDSCSSPACSPYGNSCCGSRARVQALRLTQQQHQRLSQLRDIFSLMRLHRPRGQTSGAPQRTKPERRWGRRAACSGRCRCRVRGRTDEWMEEQREDFKYQSRYIRQKIFKIKALQVRWSQAGNFRNEKWGRCGTCILSTGSKKKSVHKG